MPLTDEDKDNIKVVVKEAMTGQQAPSDLEKTRLQYKADINELLAKNQELVGKMQQSLHELELYKWGIRLIIVIFLGGSLLTVLKYKEVIDAQIMLRLAQSDRNQNRLNFASELNIQGRWREALALLDQLWRDKSLETADPQYKSFFFRNVLSAVSQTEEPLPNGSWVGEDQWKKLNQDPDFRAEFITRGSWDNDPVVNNDLGYAYVKFEPGSTSIAKTYFQRALDSSHPEIRKAPNCFALAMIALIEGDKDTADEKFRQAGQLDPSYGLEDFSKYKDAILKSPEFTVWEGIAKRKGLTNFKTLFADSATRVSAASRSPARRVK